MNDADEEEFVAEDEEELGPALIKKLREKLKAAVEEKQQYLDGWQRARADFANFKREEALMSAHTENKLRAEFVEKLLPSIDSMQMALKHAPPQELVIVYKQLVDSLKQLGVEQYGEEGDAYDPHIHEALVQQGDGTKVIKVERSGYKTENGIIRPAQVMI